MNLEEQGKKWAQIIAKCWADEGFKQRLAAKPVATLRAEGVDVADGVTVHVVENSDRVFHLVIPPMPTDLTDEDLEHVAGGAKCLTGGGGGCSCDHPGRTYSGSIITIKQAT